MVAGIRCAVGVAQDVAPPSRSGDRSLDETRDSSVGARDRRRNPRSALLLGEACSN
jgi:hypothetical protein